MGRTFYNDLMGIKTTKATRCSRSVHRVPKLCVKLVLYGEVTSSDATLTTFAQCVRKHLECVTTDARMWFPSFLHHETQFLGHIGITDSLPLFSVVAPHVPHPIPIRSCYVGHGREADMQGNDQSWY